MPVPFVRVCVCVWQLTILFAIAVIEFANQVLSQQCVHVSVIMQFAQLLFFTFIFCCFFCLLCVVVFCPLLFCFIIYFSAHTTPFS